MIAPTCGACGLVMTPADSRIHPELFFHDACLPDELKEKQVDRPAPVVYDYSAHAPVGCAQCAFLAQRERELLAEVAALRADNASLIASRYAGYTALKNRIAELEAKVIHV